MIIVSKKQEEFHLIRQQSSDGSNLVVGSAGTHNQLQKNSILVE
jgi:hypothetical protein